MSVTASQKTAAQIAKGNGNAPAQPVEVAMPYKDGTWTVRFPGMTKREEMATAIMQGLVTRGSWDDPAVPAKHAVLYADALLAELDNPKRVT